MITMQFDDIQKIWDAQNNETLFAINKEALHKRIKSRKNKIEKAQQMDTVGLILISFIVSATLLIIDYTGIFNIATSVMLMGIAVYIYFRNTKRKKSLAHFDSTILGDLDHSIKNMKSRIRFAQTFWLWYITPLGAAKVLDVFYAEGVIEMRSIVVLVLAFILAFFVTAWSVKAKYKPQLKKLEAMRNKLVEEEEAA